MTELEYVIQNFHMRFSEFQGRRIVLHGSREYAREILKHEQDSFHFVGISSLEEIESGDLKTLPVLSEAEMWEASPELIILTERVKYEEEVYRLISEGCKCRGILLYNMYGKDLIKLHEAAEAYQVLTTYRIGIWKDRLKAYDLVVFETVDTVFEAGNDQLRMRPLFAELITWLAGEGIRIAFSLRKSFDEQIQAEALAKALNQTSLPVFPDTQTGEKGMFLIRRKGEDLSFRLLRQVFPGKKIIYIGSGLVNEYLLPADYGLDVWRFRDQYDCLAPVMEPDRDSAVSGETIAAGSRQDLAEYRILIDENDVISFDIFDTLVSRKVLIPEDLFVLTERSLAAKGLRAGGYARIRQEVQNQYECPEAEYIFQAVGRKMHWTEAEAEEAAKTELELEHRLLYRREDVLDLFEYAIESGKDVILTSDMYFSESELAELLAGLGISGWKKIFVSCEYGKDKQHGLFGALRAYGGSESRILHIDDRPDFRADCEKEQIRFLYVPSITQKAVREGWGNCFRLCTKPEERYLLGLTLAMREQVLSRSVSENRADQFAVSVVGPLLIGYLTWLIKEVSSRRFDRILFFARDGWLVKQAYDQAAEICGLELPESVYFYTSRHAAHFLMADDSDTIRKVIRQGEGNGLTAYELLKKVYGLFENELLPVQESEEIFDSILRHSAALERKRKEAMEGWRHYLKDIGLEKVKTCAVSDLFASGSTQHFLKKAVPFEMTGFYLGNYKADSEAGCQISYYLKGRNDALLRNYIEAEACLTSPEPSVDRIDHEGKVIFSEDTRSPETLETIGRIQQLALRMTVDFFRLFYEKGTVISPDLIEELYALRDGRPVIKDAYNDFIGMPIRGKRWGKGSIQPEN